MDTVFSMEKSVNARILPLTLISQWEHMIQWFDKQGKLA